MTGKHKIISKLFFILAILACGVFLSLRVSLNDNALNLLPDTAVKSGLQKLQDLGLVNRLFITVSVDTERFSSPAEARVALKTSTDKLAALLETSKNITNVAAKLPAGYEFGLFNTVFPALPALLDESDLKDIKNKISVSSLQESMQKNFAILNSPAGIGMKGQIQKDPLGFSGLLFQKLSYLRTEMTMHIEDGFFMSNDGNSCLVQAESVLSLVDSKVAETVEADLIGMYEKALSPGVSAMVIGSLPHTLANSRTIQNDLKCLLPVASILLVLLLGITLKNIRAFAVFSIPFLAAPLAVGMTSWYFGSISGMALGFGIVLLGIAVDFSVHLYLALDREDGPRKEVLKRIYKPIFFATMTTASVFGVLALSDVPSHRQMAMLAFIGVVSAVALAVMAIPLIVPDKRDVKCKKQTNNFTPPIISTRRRLSLLLIWAVFLMVGCFSWPKLQYNGDLQVLDVPDQQVKSDEELFTSIWGEKTNQAFIISEGQSEDEALENNSLVYQFLKENGFEHFQTISSILPGENQQKKNIENWDVFWGDVSESFESGFNSVASKYGFSQKAFVPFFTWLSKDTKTLSPAEFMDGPLDMMFSTLLRKPEQGNYMALTTVSLEDIDVTKLFELEDYSHNITVLSNSRWRGEVEAHLKNDILKLCFIAGLIVLILVAFQFRNVLASFAVLAPVLSALSAMSIFCWLTGSELNMMHLIMGIMVIGLSVDYGIFIVCSKLEEVKTVSTMAVSICAASSLIGFGVLAFASHPALHSLGITVLVGIGVAWPVAIFVTPLFLPQKKLGEK